MCYTFCGLPFAIKMPLSLAVLEIWGSVLNISCSVNDRERNAEPFGRLMGRCCSVSGHYFAFTFRRLKYVLQESCSFRAAAAVHEQQRNMHGEHALPVCEMLAYKLRLFEIQ
jgi:hypothetical protein